MSQQNSTIHSLLMPLNSNKRSQKRRQDFNRSILWFIFYLNLFFLFPQLHLNAQNGIKREMRAAWIATVKNIDWPTSPFLSVDSQKAEADRILDSLKSFGINTVYLQVRSSADALYSKSREPWSEWLTGKQGQAPDPPYDPLIYFLNGAHDRGMELHAWVNPYRAVFNNALPNLASNHMVYQHPEWFFKYGTRTLFNPGIPEVRDYIESIILDIVQKYDVDGIHMDDYFYPYPISGQPIPDAKTYIRYGAGFKDINEWRRNNVNLLVKELNEKIKAEKPYVKFGISPFGVWRNYSQDSLGSDTHGGSSYDLQFADTRKWIKEGWLDYLVPQIYFTLEFQRLPFLKAVEWWNQNTFSRQVYIGLGLYRIGEKNDHWTDPMEIPNQIIECRKMDHISGMAFFSTRSILINKLGVSDSLKKDFFSLRALPPRMKWIDSIPPSPPDSLVLDTIKTGIKLKWKAPPVKSVLDSSLYYLVYRFNEGEELNTDYTDHLVGMVYRRTEFADEKILPHHKYIYLVTATDRLWNESKCSPPLLYSCPPL